MHQHALKKFLVCHACKAFVCSHDINAIDDMPKMATNFIGKHAKCYIVKYDGDDFIDCGKWDVDSYDGEYDL